MPVVFGLDLKQIRWSAFKSKNMFDKKYYLRPQRFVFYQLAMIITIAGEVLATITLSKSYFVLVFPETLLMSSLGI
jgi:hypothetical protein